MCLRNQFTQLWFIFYSFFVAMKLAAARQTIIEACSSYYEKEELIAVSRRILEHLSGKTNLQMLVQMELEIDHFALFQILEMLKRDTPIQYVLGYEWFSNLKLKVSKEVLIPRPETEELTRIIISFLKKKEDQSISILDIGTGSGAIPILVKKEIPEASLFAIDISEPALLIAKENAISHNCNIHFILANILDKNLNVGLSFDIIISNPPYIMHDEKVNMHERVASHEPAIALFVTDNDPLQFYRAILNFSKKYLIKDGTLFLEINSLYAQSIKALFEMNNFTCEILKDLYGNDRFAIVKFRPFL